MKKQYTKAFREEIIQIVYTDYGSAEQKEDRLCRCFERKGYTYSREAVKDAVFVEYLSMGGYNSRQKMTDWIFEPKNL